MNSKIVLGTVQFGLDYGINNQTGKIHANEIDKILIAAHSNYITMLDTSFAYGDSEKVIGQSLQRINIPFQIVSKIPKTDFEPQEILNKSLNSLICNSLYGYLIHNFSYYINNPEIWDFLKRKKEEGIFKKIGFSLYYPYELEYLLDNKVNFDLVQVPYNIFDRRFERFFKSLRMMDVEIHVRSVFLQGLFFINLENIPSYFDSIKNKLIELNQISKKTGISISHLCLCFVMQNEFINKVVIGVDSEKNLLENIHYNKKINEFRKISKRLNLFEVKDESILLPFNWK